MDALLSVAPADALATHWRRLRAADPPISLGDAVAALDVVEAELLGSLCGDGVRRLDSPFGDLVHALPALGRVRATTRNSHAAIETRGAYPSPELGCAGVAGDVGARFMFEHWRYGYAVEEGACIDEAPGLRFYDARGEAVHEIHAEPETNRRVLAKLADVFASFHQAPGERIRLASPDVSTPRHDLSAWLRQGEDARPVALAAVVAVLQAARREAIPVSLAVRSPGIVQRFSGLLEDVTVGPGRVDVRAAWVRAWIATERLAEVWMVRSPSVDGPTTSLHLLDAGARVVATLAGVRWPGKPEPEPWRSLLERLLRD